MALTAQNSPLVAGSEFDLKQGRLAAKAGQLRVVRAICVKGQRIEVGEIARGLDPSTATELISAGKLVREPVPAEPSTDKKSADTSKPTAKAAASSSKE